jgi:hypothetical protein
MTHDSQRILEANLRQYKTPTTKDAYERGFERGYNCASWQDLPEVGTELFLDGEGGVTVDEDNQWDVVQSLAYESESNDRCYSPFEFTASEFNKARNSEARWEAFDAGISDGIQANIGERMNAMTSKLVS